jgi:hypothetical protein
MLLIRGAEYFSWSFAATAAFIAISAPSYGADLTTQREAQREALQLIKEFANDICTRVPISGSQENLELTGEAKAGLTGVVSKLADLQIEGSGKLQNENHTGVLQKELAASIAKGDDCRLSVFRELKQDIIPNLISPLPSVNSENTSSLFDRTTLRYGVTLGWQLARLEFAKDSPLPEALEALPRIESNIKQLLAQDKAEKIYNGSTAPEIIENILSYYSVSDAQKYSAIMLGIASLRASLIGASSNEEHNREIQDLVEGTLSQVDSKYLPDKKKLLQKLITVKPRSVNDAVSLIDSE